MIIHETITQHLYIPKSKLEYYNHQSVSVV